MKPVIANQYSPRVFVAAEKPSGTTKTIVAAVAIIAVIIIGSVVVGASRDRNLDGAAKGVAASAKRDRENPTADVDQTQRFLHTTVIQNGKVKVTPPPR